MEITPHPALRWLKRKVIGGLIITADYLAAILLLLVIGGVVLLCRPILARKRKQWQSACAGHKNLLILSVFDYSQVEKRGHEQIIPFLNEQLETILFLDPSSTHSGECSIVPGLTLTAFERPKLVQWLDSLRLHACAFVLGEFFAFRTLLDLVLDRRIGVLRAFQHNYSALRCALLKCALGVPYLVDICGNYELLARMAGQSMYFGRLNHLPVIGRLSWFMSSELLGWPLKTANLVLGRNKNNYEHAFAIGADVERLSLLRISNIDVRYTGHDPAHMPERPLDAPYILLVGRLSEEKFPLDAIAVFTHLARRYPDLHLVLVGSGPMAEKVEAEAKTALCNERIHLLGALSNAETYRWTAHASVALAPYSGSTLVEAMYCNVPVVAYDIEWHAEVIMDNFTGRLVQFRDTEGMADAVAGLLDNPEKAALLGRKARELALAVFDSDELRRRETQIYAALLRSVPSPDGAEAEK